MPKFVSGFAMIALLVIAIYSYEKAKSEYDPEAICARQTDVSKDQCLSAISFAMSAGW